MCVWRGDGHQPNLGTPLIEGSGVWCFKTLNISSKHISYSTWNQHRSLKFFLVSCSSSTTIDPVRRYIFRIMLCITVRSTYNIRLCTEFVDHIIGTRSTYWPDLLCGTAQHGYMIRYWPRYCCATLCSISTWAVVVPSIAVQYCASKVHGPLHRAIKTNPAEPHLFVQWVPAPDSG